MAYRYEDDDYDPDLFYDDDGFDDHYYYYDDDDLDHLEFANPGGRSALRAGERTEPCPTCGRENVLTKKDVSLHYQCDRCADIAEGRMVGGMGEY